MLHSPDESGCCRSFPRRQTIVFPGHPPEIRGSCLPRRPGLGSHTVGEHTRVWIDGAGDTKLATLRKFWKEGEKERKEIGHFYSSQQLPLEWSCVILDVNIAPVGHLQGAVPVHVGLGSWFKYTCCQLPSGDLAFIKDFHKIDRNSLSTLFLLFQRVCLLILTFVDICVESMRRT